MNNLEALQDFIKRAERNYKYKPNTATALSGGLRLFRSVMTDEELSEATFPLDKLDEIAERIHTKFPTKYGVDSLRTYKSRINRVVADFANFGADAKSMASWNPLTKQRRTKPKGDAAESNVPSPQEDIIHTSENTTAVTEKILPGLQDITLPLAGTGRSIVIYYPSDLSETEAEKIGIVLKGIAALGKVES